MVGGAEWLRSRVVVFVHDRGHQAVDEYWYIGNICFEFDGVFTHWHVF